MTRKDAYNFFLDALKQKLIKRMHDLDKATPGSTLHNQLTAEVNELQRLLAALDDIANATK
ncbi:hypothetical protein [Burkholderia vietnamiensis]|nr:hypothetical protein [Burkholderia vietnamiensis]MCA8199264.1 hypothetical protein [Burkholderia vietnamiensis]HDR9229499.1 hypothetical protein [Burkholderia vietnamiensis]